MEVRRFELLASSVRGKSHGVAPGTPMSTLVAETNDGHWLFRDPRVENPMLTGISGTSDSRSTSPLMSERERILDVIGSDRDCGCNRVPVMAKDHPGVSMSNRSASSSGATPAADRRVNWPQIPRPAEATWSAGGGESALHATIEMRFDGTDNLIGPSRWCLKSECLCVTRLDLFLHIDEVG